MKLTTAVGAAALAASSVNGAALQPRHYTFPSIDSTADWSSVRQTANFQSNAGLQDVTSEQIRCYTTGTRSASVTTSVAAGGSVSFKASPNIFHPGPLQFYMAKVPAGKTAANWDGAGQVWFKIYAEKATASNGGLAWASMNKGSVSVTIPKATPSGEYLLRIEHIALHGASQPNGAQFYISCAQISVTGGGSGTPAPLVSFPGVYKATDPGIKVNIYGVSIHWSESEWEESANEETDDVLHAPWTCCVEWLSRGVSAVGVEGWGRTWEVACLASWTQDVANCPQYAKWVILKASPKVLIE
jgi:hypothetical protein